MKRYFIIFILLIVAAMIYSCEAAIPVSGAAATWVAGALGIGGIGAILAAIMKKWLSQERLDIWGDAVEKCFYGLGVVITLGASKIKYLKNIWNVFIEPFVIIVFELLITRAAHGLTDGLESDQPSLKETK